MCLARRARVRARRRPLEARGRAPPPACLQRAPALLMTRLQNRNGRARLRTVPAATPASSAFRLRRWCACDQFIDARLRRCARPSRNRAFGRSRDTARRPARRAKRLLQERLVSRRARERASARVARRLVGRRPSAQKALVAGCDGFELVIGSIVTPRISKPPSARESGGARLESSVSTCGWFEGPRRSTAPRVLRLPIDGGAMVVRRPRRRATPRPRRSSTRR